MIEANRRAALLALLTLLVMPAFAQPDAPPGERPSERAGPPPEGQAQNAPSPVAADMARRMEATIDLDELLAQVAAAENKQFLVDPRVRARVLVVPPIESPTYEQLLAILRIHGFAAVDIDGRIHVIPDAAARVMPTRVVQRDDSTIPDDELVSRVVTLNIENAALLVPILRPLLPQYAHLAAMGNKLVIVDHYGNVRRITELANALSD